MEMLLRDYDQMTSQELWRRFNIQPFNVKKIVDGQGDELMCSAIEGLQFSGFDTTDIPRFFRNVAVGQITDTFAEMGLFSPEASEPLPSDTFDQLDLALLKAGRSIPAEKQNMLQMAPLVDASLWLRDWQGGQWDVNHRSIKGKCDMTNFELLSAATARAVADQIGGNSDIFDITDNYGDIDDYMLFGLNSGGSCVYLPMVPPVRTKSTIAGLGVSWRRFQYPDRKDQPEFSMIVKGTWGESSFPPVSYFLQ